MCSQTQPLPARVQHVASASITITLDTCIPAAAANPCTPTTPCQPGGSTLQLLNQLLAETNSDTCGTHQAAAVQHTQHTRGPCVLKQPQNCALDQPPSRTVRLQQLRTRQLAPWQQPSMYFTHVAQICPESRQDPSCRACAHLTLQPGGRSASMSAATARAAMSQDPSARNTLQRLQPVAYSNQHWHLVAPNWLQIQHPRGQQTVDAQRAQAPPTHIHI
jgi:hypothetical protein